MVTSELSGEIKVNNSLGGTPDVSCWLRRPVGFWDFSVHECLMEAVHNIES